MNRYDFLPLPSSRAHRANSILLFRAYISGPAVYHDADDSEEENEDGPLHILFPYMDFHRDDADGLICVTSGPGKRLGCLPVGAGKPVLLLT